MRRRRLRRLRRRIRRNRKKIARLSTRHSDTTTSHSERLGNLEDADSFAAIVIGAGPSGAYAARKIRKRFPGRRILLLEKSDRVGGRLMSEFEVSNNKGDSPIYDELGGMRVFRHLMPEVVSAIEETECTMVHVPLDVAAENLFYYKGVRHTKKDFRINNQEVPHLLARAIRNFVDETGHVGDFHNSDLVRSLTARQFMQRFGMEIEEIEALLAYGGYDEIDEHYHAAVVLDDEEFYTGGSLSDDHHFVAEGYATVVKRLVSRSNVELKLNSEVTSIEKNMGGDLVVRYTHGEESLTVSAPRVFLCVAGEAIGQLMPNFVAPERRSVLDFLTCIPLFKCFLHWDDPVPDLRSQVTGSVKQWWHELGYTRGKHTTDLPIRMVWNYDTNDILIYNSGWSARQWHEAIQEEGIISVAQTMVGMLEEMFGVEVPPPNYEKTLYKYWPDGVAAWAAGTDVPSSIEKLCDGKSDGSSVYVCGDANSRLQGWVAGAFQSVECALRAAGI